MRSQSQVLGSLGFAALLLAGCGAGVAGVVASSGDGNGGGSPPAIVNFRIEGTKRAPAEISFDLVNASATVELSYRLPGDPPGPPSRPLTRVTGVPGNPALLQPGRATIEWAFPEEDGIPDDSCESDCFLVGVQVHARIVGHSDAVVPGVNASDPELGLGNDLPRVTSLSAREDSVEGEASGIVLVEGLIEDTPGDRVDVRVEYDLGDGKSWRLARPAETPEGAETPPLAFTDTVIGEKGSTAIAFFWDTPFDMGHDDTDVMMRFVPLEDVEGMQELGVPATDSFHIDNNEEPIVQIEEGFFLLNPDERAGIPVVYRVIDEEEDPVHVLFQWRRSGEDFPALDTDDPVEIEAIVRDAGRSRELHVCSSYPSFARGRVMPVDPLRVHLPELSASESWVLAAGQEDLLLEILRPSAVPSPVAGGWAVNPLSIPVAVLPLADSPSALVLEAADGGWRLSEIDLATGEVERRIANGTGLPSAMAFEAGERSVLVASATAGAWHVDRVQLEGTRSTWLDPGPGARPGPLRSLASLGRDAALACAGDALLRLDSSDAGNPRVSVVLEGLATPWGIALDPSRNEHLYLAERDAPVDGGRGRVLSVDLDAHSAAPVLARSPRPGAPAFSRPTALALEDRGTRLLALCDDEAPGVRALLAVQLGGRGGSETRLLAELPHEALSLATGGEELRLVALGFARDLAVGGGVEQVRRIEQFEPAGAVARASTPFAPAPRIGQRWRIRPRHPFEDPVRGSSAGERRVFVWDSGDVPAGGGVFLRALALDDELGRGSATTVAKNVSSGLQHAPIVLGQTTTSAPASVSAADIDGDGDLDLAFANAANDTLTVFSQGAPGSFDPDPILVGGSAAMSFPRSLAPADLDGDGDMDLASANEGSGNITAFFQRTPGIFDPNPLAIPVPGGVSVFSSPEGIVAADFDDDGDLELASANGGSSNLTIFFQISPGRFASTPLTLGAGFGGINPRFIGAADLDGDGDLDVASANPFRDNLTIFFQTSAGTFDPRSLTLDHPERFGSPQSFDTGDLDGDGDTDLVSANSGGDDLTVFLQGRPGRFQRNPLVLESPDTLAPQSVSLADIDGDGDLDLGSVNFGSDNLTLFFQDAPGRFSPDPLIAAGRPVISGPRTLTTADLDADGRVDLACVNEDARDLTVFLQDSPGSFDPVPTVLGGPRITNFPGALVAADLDGDGDLDLGSANRFSDDLTLFFQAGPGSFDPDPLVLDHSPALEGPRSMAAADLDGDGDLDVAAANTDSNSVTVFLQTDPGSFASSGAALGSFPTLDFPRSLTAADLDGDGDIDLACANGESDNITVFFQRNPGSFDSVPLALGSLPTTDSPQSVAAADLDRDGDIDLASANSLSQDLTLFFQTSPGTFDPDPVVLVAPSALAPFALAPADIDADGKLDLVSANAGSDTLVIFFQAQGGSFDLDSLAIDVPGSPFESSPISVVAADLDEDGDLDLASANSSGGNLTVFFQASSARFESAPLVLGGSSVTSNPGFLIAVDIDGDGDLELASANIADLTVFWGNR